MSDFKDKFRAAAAQRGSAAPSKEQIRALKAQKQAQALKGGSERPAPTPPKEHSAGAERAFAPAGQISQGQPSASLPADFFQEQKAPASVSSVAPASAPSAAAVARSAGAAGPKAALPQGFFSDKAADAKARGEKLPDKKEKDEEFKQFQLQIDEEIKEIAAKQAEEADEEAELREDREAFEQRERVRQMEQLRHRKAAGPGPSSSLAEEPAFSLALPAPKRRVIDVLQEQLAGGDGSDGEGTDDEEDLVLDWRAKGV